MQQEGLVVNSLKAVVLFRSMVIFVGGVDVSCPPWSLCLCFSEEDPRKTSEYGT